MHVRAVSGAPAPSCDGLIKGRPCGEPATFEITVGASTIDGLPAGEGIVQLCAECLARSGDALLPGHRH